MKLSAPYQVLLILSYVLVVYYPSIFGGLHSIDDEQMSLLFEVKGHVPSLRELFLGNDGIHYRPLLMLTFVADHYLWNMTPMFMHFENILLHAANTVFVFFLARKFFQKIIPSDTGMLPLLSGLVFGIHPINTESVNWISGRTDPLATLFLLPATILFMQSVEQRSLVRLAAGILCFLGAIMSKEVSIFFYPIACVVLLFWPPAGISGKTAELGIRTRIGYVSLLSLPFIILLIVYGMNAPEHSDKTFDALLRKMISQYSLLDLFLLSFKSFGFYVKKLFLPLPLNFAIDDVSTAYAAIGAVALVATISILALRMVQLSGLIVSWYMITPAIVLALSRAAWTPFAERYVYTSSAFFAIGFICLLHMLFARFGRAAWAGTVSVMLIFSASAVSAHRNVQWKDNLRFFEDATAKSPGFYKIRNDLGVALAKAGKIEEAEAEFEKGIAESKGGPTFLFSINLAHIHLNRGDYEKAQEVITKAFDSKDAAHEMVLEMLARVEETRVNEQEGLSGEERQTIGSDLIDTLEHIHKKTGDPHYLYRAGKIALTIGRREKAVQFFNQAYNLAPPDAHYRDAALKLARKLDQP